ncbi:probable linoleate 9S-lipoxygenase 5 isoform X3 [Carya illinoinensis]|uniref:probable linoleate 9S-lipoxygenase 5 isoform X3 n=1 Tax=Carya illinoinensis TaxID=32201 RepID=UPI001C71A51E|nr:probable linoleate 9S-lipoxygenase 5 isoform X3 [Carya illinoinensis]
MFHSTDLALSPMKSLAAGTSYGVLRPISTFKPAINGEDRVSSVNSTTTTTHITFTWKRHGFSSMTGLKRSRRLSITSMGQTPRGANYEVKKKIKGSVVLMKKNVLDLNDIHASVLDRLLELFNRRVSLQLISAFNCDPKNGLQGKLGQPAYLEDWIAKITPLTASESAFDVTFDWDNELGVPGAFLIRNNHHSEFYLKSVTLEDVPGQGQIHFVCNSWVYPADKYKKDRIFFTNKTYLPSETPAPLLKYRKEELVSLRGDGKSELQEWDRIYDYAYYNDLGRPDEDPKYERPVLGGSSKYPYPRRGRTSRPPTKKGDVSAWRTDEEFAREMLAGVNPVIIRLLQEFPPSSKLDSTIYGDQTSTITMEHVEKYLNGLTIDEAIRNKKLFILDHHDALMPYLWRIINCTSTKIYASRTLLFLKEDGTLKPLAIELSLPHPNGYQFGAVSKVYTPAEEGVQSNIWQMAKAYVAVNDTGYHQLISHWLHTHAAIEPFVIATNRQLSVLHPIYKLLHPHFRDTMNINALAREILINAGGALEHTVFPAKFSMEFSSMLYKDWVFPEQALPSDLIKRGMAVKDENSPHGVRLVIEDYPYAVDGLEIWSAIKEWVEDYCSFYYKTDDMVQNDSELQSWWKELREEGHGDKKDEPWWPEMQTLEELVETCTIIIWIASALHAAINFGQYPLGGYPPNRPAISRRFMPEEGTPDYKELKTNPEKAFLKTFSSQLLTVIGIAVIEVLSKHSSDEIYLGQRDTPKWTSDTKPLEAFYRFGMKLAEIEDRITRRNYDKKLRNRVGPVKMPYTLLYPSSGQGLTGKGIPNSVTI